MEFHDLNNEQAHGHACVTCRESFLFDDTDAIAVGASATTGETVRAHPGQCATGVGHRAELGEQLALEASR